MRKTLQEATLQNKTNATQIPGEGYGDTETAATAKTAAMAIAITTAKTRRRRSRTTATTTLTADFFITHYTPANPAKSIGNI